MGVQDAQPLQMALANVANRLEKRRATPGKGVLVQRDRHGNEIGNRCPSANEQGRIFIGKRLLCSIQEAFRYFSLQTYFVILRRKGFT
ncbi:hypothetical protein D478_07703 [Brevibacillus agri BAB-2500]|nr:hypothetical protein D478_07703 [Brevibacillus agri BAB-2500]